MCVTKSVHMKSRENEDGSNERATVRSIFLPPLPRKWKSEENKNEEAEEEGWIKQPWG